ncbi:MAG TPA: hypothetical protein VM283_09665, partial [Armatimonadota bacterium]|nr:hypothetical protein [Armatimonadota bacterium]
RWRPLYKKYMPVIIALCEAGWEPVTLARIEPEGALIERFGLGVGRPGTELYLVAHNPTDETLAVTITPDFAELGIEAPGQVEALPGGGQIAVAGGAFADTLAPRQTRAYRLVAVTSGARG